ncbi:MAG TPA: hypothetical protein VFI63_00890 [Solirubrobacterales bacterium]|nr:hypothetical protein [Solirubrobacterales bacterium]
MRQRFWRLARIALVAACGWIAGAGQAAAHIGPVMLGTTNVYYVFYGNWSGEATQTAVVTTFAQCVGGSPYYNINTTYYDTMGRHVSNSVHYGGSVVDAYSHGTSLTDSAVKAIVSGAITSGALPADAHGVYYVLATPDVNETSGLCTAYCGWHNHATISGVDIKFAFVGDPDRCPSACSSGYSPSGDAGADAMAGTIAKLLNETVTDPDLNGWYDSSGSEFADKCAWSFGTLYPTPNGSHANVRLCNADFILPENWVNVSPGYCALHYP